MEQEFKQPALENTSVQGQDTRHGENPIPTREEFVAAGYNAADYDRRYFNQPGYVAPVDPDFVDETDDENLNDDAPATDELSVALAESRKPKTEIIPEPEKPRGRFALSYRLHGVPVVETHATVPHALARIAALGRLGITPKTSTL